MENSFFHRLSRTLWICIVVVMVLLAVYVGAGRLLMANLGGYQKAILQELNVRFPFSLEATQVSGQWRSFSPEIIFTDLRLSFPDNPEAPIELSEGRVSIDVLNSLRTLSMRLNRVALTELSLRGVLAADGSVNLTGFSGGGGQGVEGLQDFLLNIENITLRDNLLNLTMPNGEERVFDLNLILSRFGSHRKVDATLVSTAGMEITVLANGVGSPLQPEKFSGDVYLSVHSPDLGTVKAILADGSPPYWATGEVDLELWVALEEGLAAVEGRFDGKNIVISSEDSQQQWPFDTISLQAHLAEGKDRWTLFATDVVLGEDGKLAHLPAVQLDFWGDAMRARLIDVSLQPVAALVTGLDVLSPRLLEVFTELQPRGHVAALQFSVGDIENPASDWELEANFTDVAVESYRGAPGVDTATGYARLGVNGGYVVLDSQPFTLDFPRLYKEPLAFDDLHGTLHLAWDSEAFSISSGLVTAIGEEGTATVLFGLDVPLKESVPGIEMDLMIGLQQMQTRYRNKYIPYTLQPMLLSWLDQSIGEGIIEQGAFLWRGSLRAGAAPMRTVQLAFNVSDTELDYHPQWPAVVIEQGVAFIDDTAVSVWAEQGTLFDSTVQDISVEIQLNDKKELLLDITGRVVGEAADGLRVLNDSALTTIVGDAFSQWSMIGKLEADLDIRLNLTNKAVPPQVEVATRWRDTDIVIVPGNLSLDDVNGTFDYSTRAGFGSSGLTGKLWDKAFKAQLQQDHTAASGQYEAGSSVLNLTVDTRVAMSDLQSWLHLKPLEMATGEAAATIGLRLQPKQPLQLSAHSDLVGVALDLPQPWRLSAAAASSMAVQMPLSKAGYDIRLQLQDALNLKLSMAQGKLAGGALGINSIPSPIEAGSFVVSGHAAALHSEELLAFVTTYFSADELLAGAVATPGSEIQAAVEPMQNGSPQEKTASPMPLRIVVDQLQVEQLQIAGQQFEAIAVSMDLNDSQWSVNVFTDWLRGTVALARGTGVSTIDVEYLDLSRLPDLEMLEEREPGSVIDLPPLDVTLHELHQGGRLLGDVTFLLRSENGVLRAQNIMGNLASVTLNEEQPGELIWHQVQNERTELKAGLAFVDLGETLEYFGYQRILNTSEGQIDVDLSWPGTPLDFSVLNGRGSMQIAIGSGNFPEAPPGAAGALKVVSILNLADMVRRLSMTQMFDSGIPFASVDGEVYLHKGTVEVARMDVKGPASFQFTGVSDVAKQSLNGELVATLPVANNLTWVAALAASVPVAAGVFIVSKVFDKQMNRLTSAVYTIGGSWNEPSVSFDRIFDDTTKSNGEAQLKRLLEADAVAAVPEQGASGAPEEPVPADNSVESQPSASELESQRAAVEAAAIEDVQSALP